jgi:hypothetical protein
MKFLIPVAFAQLCLGLVASATETSFNYAEALQKSVYFYEAQQSGATGLSGAGRPA